MAATNVNLEIPQGGTYQLVINIEAGPADLTGYTGHMQFREIPGGQLLENLDTDEITVDSGNRQVTITIPDEKTRTYTWTYAAYDLLILGPVGDFRVIEGRIIVSHSVTQEV